MVRVFKHYDEKCYYNDKECVLIDNIQVTHKHLNISDLFKLNM